MADLDFTQPADEPGTGENRQNPAAGSAKRRRRWRSTGDAATGNAATDGSAAPDGEKPEKKGSFWKELPILIIVALLLTFLIQTFLARVYVIPSQSMEQTLHGCTGCTNDRVLVDKLIYRFRDPRPGDVVVFKGPDSWGDNPEFDAQRPSSALARGLHQFGSLIGLASPDERDFVKRVIATGGQTVQCCDDRGRVMVDGKPLNEPYLFFEEGRGGSQEPFPAIQVPEDHLWVMGDNRNNSSDSRRHTDDADTGSIPIDNVIGKARVIVLPPSRWSGISDFDPQFAALAAPAWHSGLPAAVGLLLAWPVLRTGQALRALGAGGPLRTGRAAADRGPVRVRGLRHRLRRRGRR